MYSKELTEENTLENSNDYSKDMRITSKLSKRKQL